jgi:hypothetical protein
MNSPQPDSPQRRLQELLAIPERERTDSQWDELNELEIKLASANREDAPEQGARRDTPTNANHPNRGKPRGGPQGKKPPRKFHK